MNEYTNIPINNHPHQIRIAGDTTKPILLILHGGPGTPCMTLFRKWNQPLLEDYLVVTYDQRGTGRSFTKHLDLSTLTVNQLVKDVHEMTDYLKTRFNRNKIFLLGHSFGATLGLRVVSEKPDNYYAYIGVSQFVNATENEALCYQWLVEETTKHNDIKALKTLQQVGAPVEGFYSSLKDTMKVKQLVTKYKGDTRADFSTLDLLKTLFFSKEYGFHRFFNAVKSIQVSLSTIGYDLRGIDYTRSIKELNLPVYFLSGKYDQLTPQSLLIDYYDQLQAPKKELHRFELSAHNLLWNESDKFHKLLHHIAMTETTSVS